MKNSLIALIVICAVDSFATTPESFDPKASDCSFEKFMTNYVRSQKNALKINSFLVSDSAAHPEGDLLGLLASK